MRKPSKDLILKFLNEADNLLSKGDLVQACEKYYKAAEEAINLLVIE
ncbi:PaREP1 family protein, partial [Acidianus infernus]